LADVTIDLSNCDREPIHLLGAIQPFGFLIAVSADWIVTRVSRNLGDFCGRDAQQMLGLPLAAFMESEAVEAIRQALRQMDVDQGVERLFNLSVFGTRVRFDLAVHVATDVVVIEGEPTREGPSFNAAGFITRAAERLSREETLEGLCGEGARLLQQLIDFDRVMIYRFAADGSGQVIGEAVKPGVPSYLGLRYPASDIPAQARRLYETNLLRIIADIEAEPVPILPERDPMGAPLDLSLSVLRSVSPIHIEYLRNMGVRASLSVSVMHRGRLWGLMACHDYAPKHLDFERRTTCELFGRVFSLTLEARKQRIREAQERRARIAHDKLMRTVATHGRPFERIGDILGDLRQMVDCDGVGVSIDGEIHVEGVTPTGEEMQELVRFLNRAAASRIYATHQLGTVFERGRDFVERAAGVLAIPISRAPRDYLIFFRREIVRSVNWAGKPEKVAALGPNGVRLTPRKSFEAWRETVAGQSALWTDFDLQAAELVRISLLEIVLQITDAAERERRSTQERQELLIAELNHRVRNILGLIRGLVSQGRRTDDPERFANELNARIEALARAHDQITRDDWKPAPLRALVEAEAAAYLGEERARMDLSGPNVLIHPKAFSTMAMVFHELTTNAAKYGALSDGRGRVAVTWRIDEGGNLIVTWTESGGPPVQPTMRRGFGTTIIERTVPSELRGEAEFRLDLAGVKARYLIPGEYVTVISAAPNRVITRLPMAAQAVIAGHCLLVEDNAIIALDAEQILEELGATSVEQVATVAEAMAALESRRPDFALLDFNLGPETSLAFAMKLAEEGVAFIFATGYGEQLKLPEAIAATPIVSKPFTKASLTAGIRRLRPDGESASGRAAEIEF